MATGERFIGVSEAARILGVSERTLRRWAAEKKLPVKRVGRQWRFDRRDLHRQSTLVDTPLSQSDAPPELPHRLPFPSEQLRTMVKSFRQKVHEYDPDIIIVEDRQAHRAVARLGLLNEEEYAGRIYFPGSLSQMSERELRELGEQARILVVDEAAARARGHTKYRELFPQARIHSLVLAVLSSSRDRGELEDLGLEYCAELSPQQYRRFGACLLELTASSRPIDADHLNAIFQIPPEDWGRLRSLLPGWGQPWDLTPFVGSGSLEVWTLDDPTFFRLPKTDRAALVFDGSCKVRLYYDSVEQHLTLVPICYPTAELSPDVTLSLLDTTGWSFGKSALPKDFDELEPTAQAACGYRVLTTVLSAQLLCQFLEGMREYFDNDQLANSFHLSRDELFPELHPQSFRYIYEALDHSFREAVSRPPSFPGFDTRHDWEWVTYERPHEDKQTPSKFSMARTSQVAIDWLADEIDRRSSSGEPENRLYVPGTAILNGIRERDKGITYGDFSQWLDFSLDQTIAKPGEYTEGLGGENFLVARGYALGENSGKKLDTSRPPGGKFIASRRNAQGNDQVERCYAALYTALRGLSEATGERAFDEFLVQKILANLQLDWPLGDFDPLAFRVRPYRYGPVVDVPQRHSRLNEYLGIAAATRRSVYVRWSPDMKRLGPSTGLLPAQMDHLEEFLPYGEEQTIIGLVRFYCDIIRDFDKGSFSRPETLLQLAIARNESIAYEYLRIELSIWMDDFEDLRAVLLGVGPGRQISGQSAVEVKACYKNLRAAPDEIRRKSKLVRLMPETLKKLHKRATADSNNRALRTLVRELDKTVPGLLSAREPIQTVSDLASTLDALNVLARQVCLLNLGQAVSSESIKKATQQLLERHGFLGIECDELVRQLSSGSAERSLAALTALARLINTRLFSSLPEEGLLQLKERIETRYRQLDKEVMKLSVSAGSDCLIGYMDILGVLNLIVRLVDQDRAADHAEALKLCCDPINEVLEEFFNENPEGFELIPLRAGGDGWVVAFRHDQGPNWAIDHAVHLMRRLQQAHPIRMPTLGLHPGKPQIGLGGPGGLASIVAYLYTEKSRRASYGDIVLSEAFADGIQRDRPVLAKQIKCLTEEKRIELPMVGETHVFRFGYT